MTSQPHRMRPLPALRKHALLQGNLIRNIPSISAAQIAVALGGMLLVLLLGVFGILGDVLRSFSTSFTSQQVENSTIDIANIVLATIPANDASVSDTPLSELATISLFVVVANIVTVSVRTMLYHASAFFQRICSRVLQSSVQRNTMHVLQGYLRTSIFMHPVLGYSAHLLEIIRLCAALFVQAAPRVPLGLFVFVYFFGVYAVSQLLISFLVALVTDEVMRIHRKLIRRLRRSSCCPMWIRFPQYCFRRQRWRSSYFRITHKKAPLLQRTICQTFAYHCYLWAPSVVSLACILGIEHGNVQCSRLLYPLVAPGAGYSDLFHTIFSLSSILDIVSHHALGSSLFLLRVPMLFGCSLVLYNLFCAVRRVQHRPRPSYLDAIDIIYRRMDFELVRVPVSKQQADGNDVLPSCRSRCCNVDHGQEKQFFSSNLCDINGLVPHQAEVKTLCTCTCAPSGFFGISVCTCGFETPQTAHNDSHVGTVIVSLPQLPPRVLENVSVRSTAAELATELQLDPLRSLRLFTAANRLLQLSDLIFTVNETAAAGNLVFLRANTWGRTLGGGKEKQSKRPRHDDTAPQSLPVLPQVNAFSWFQSSFLTSSSSATSFVPSVTLSSHVPQNSLLDHEQDASTTRKSDEQIDVDCVTPLTAVRSYFGGSSPTIPLSIDIFSDVGRIEAAFQDHFSQFEAIPHQDDVPDEMLDGWDYKDDKIENTAAQDEPPAPTVTTITTPVAQDDDEIMEESSQITMVSAQKPFADTLPTTGLWGQELYEDCSFSKGDFLVSMLHLISREHLSKNGQTIVLQMFRMLLPKGNRVPASNAMLERELALLTSSNNGRMKKKYYCKVHGLDHMDSTTAVCHGCKRRPQYFLLAPVIDAIKAALQNPQLWHDLQYYRTVYCMKRKTALTVQNEEPPSAAQSESAVPLPEKMTDAEAQARFSKATNKNDKDMIDDIYQGLTYLWFAQHLTRKKGGVSFIFATDGVSPFSSSTYQCWPVYLAFNELHPLKRFQPQNMLLVGLWFGNGAPKFDLFLKSVVDELNHLYLEGEDIIVANNEKIQLRAVVLPLVLDLPARCKVCGHKQFNGKYGCRYCLNEGFSIKQGLRVYPIRLSKSMNVAELKIKAEDADAEGDEQTAAAPDDTEAAARAAEIESVKTTEKIIKPKQTTGTGDQERAVVAIDVDKYFGLRPSVLFDKCYEFLESRVKEIKASTPDPVQAASKIEELSVFGVKPKPYISLLEEYLPTASPVVEPMHLLWLGLVRQLLSLWTDTRYKNQPWFIERKQQRAIDQVLARVKLPKLFHRQIRSIETHLAHWKASESRYFFLYVAVPVLKDFLKPIYYNHLVDLVDTISELVGEQIQANRLDELDKKMKSLVAEFEELYGERAMTATIHSLAHIVSTVKMFGPLWTVSAFPFENANGVLTNFISGTTRFEQRACDMFRHMQSLDHLDYLIEQDKTRTDMHELLRLLGVKRFVAHKQSWTRVADNDVDAYIVGKRDALSATITKSDDCFMFHKLYFDGVMLYGKKNSVNRLFNSYTVRYFETEEDPNAHSQESASSPSQSSQASSSNSRKIVDRFGEILFFMYYKGSVGAKIAPINAAGQVEKQTKFVPISQILHQVVAINTGKAIHCKRFVGPFNDVLM